MQHLYLFIYSNQAAFLGAFHSNTVAYFFKMALETYWNAFAAAKAT